MTKRKTAGEVEEFFTDLIKREKTSTWDVKVEVDVIKGRSPRYRVKVSDMYSYALEFTFAQLKEVSEFFGTDKIDLDRDSYGGCESCDYGSSYTVTLDVG